MNVTTLFCEEENPRFFFFLLRALTALFWQLGKVSSRDQISDLRLWTEKPGTDQAGLQGAGFFLGLCGLRL